jgi:hypothetical protein
MQTPTHAVIEFLRNGAGFETGGMKHHGHHAPVQAAELANQVQGATGNRTKAAPTEWILD